MNEWEKCLAGQNYNCHDEIFLELKRRARELLAEYHRLSYEQGEEKYTVLQQLFGSIGTNVSVGNPFLCDYGKNIYMGSNVSVNMNCTFVDCNKIEIGNNVLIASNDLYGGASGRAVKAACGELEAGERNVFLPDVCSACKDRGWMLDWRGRKYPSGSYHRQRYGDRSGSVVTKDVPDNCLAAGNPCRVMRSINEP